VSAMAVDWLGKNLYILDVELKQIIVCSLLRDACTLLSQNVSFGRLRSVALDPATRLLQCIPHPQVLELAKTRYEMLSASNGIC